jgi:hypothetical protein
MTKSMPAPQTSQSINSAQLASMAQANKDNQAVNHPSSAEGGHPPTGGHFGLHPDAIDNHLKFHGSIDLGHGAEGIHLGILNKPNENLWDHNLLGAFDGCFAPVAGVGHGTELAGGLAPSNLKFFEHEGAQMKPSGLPGFHNTEEHFTHK